MDDATRKAYSQTIKVFDAAMCVYSPVEVIIFVDYTNGYHIVPIMNYSNHQGHGQTQAYHQILKVLSAALCVYSPDEVLAFVAYVNGK